MKCCRAFWYNSDDSDNDDNDDDDDDDDSKDNDDDDDDDSKDNDDFTADTDVVVGERCSVFWPHTPLQLFICSATQDEDFHHHHEYECSRDQKSGQSCKMSIFLHRSFMSN